MPSQNGEDIKTPTEPSKLGAKGIENTNEALARPKETSKLGAARQAVLTKLEEKLRGDHPDWADDEVKIVAKRMFERALSDVSGKASNEGNADERPYPPKVSKGPEPEYYESTAQTGVKQMPSAPSGLNT